MTLVQFAIILTDSLTEREGLQEAKQVRSLPSHVTNPTALLGMTERPRSRELWCSCKPTGEKEVSGHRKQRKRTPSYWP